MENREQTEETREEAEGALNKLRWGPMLGCEPFTSQDWCVIVIPIIIKMYIIG